MARITAAAACAFVVGVLGACTREVSPAAPWGIITPVGYPFGYPIAVGSDIDLSASWNATCETVNPFAGVMPQHMMSEEHQCDKQPFSLRIECRDDTLATPSLAKTPCEIRHGGVAIGYNELEQDEVRGTKAYKVRLVGKEQVAIVMTLRHGREIRVYQSPRLYLVVPEDFVVECQLRDSEHGGMRTVSCEQEQLSVEATILVRSTNAVALGEIRINGVPASDSNPISLSSVLPREAVKSCGEYRVRVEVNPTPYTIRRDLVVKMR
jgi:hypothetical protein